MITVQEVENLLIGSREYDEFGDDDYEELSWGHWLHEGTGDFEKISPSLLARTVKTVGGYEGGGEYVEMVIEVRPTIESREVWYPASRFFKKLGFYTSFNGTDFDGEFFEVFPKQRTVTVYEKS